LLLTADNPAESVEQAARQARDILVFSGTGNFNSLFGQKIPCSLA